MPGTGERLLEMNSLKRIFAVSPLQVKTYLNLNNPSDLSNANIALSIDESVFCTIRCVRVFSKFDIQYGNLQATSIYGGAVLELENILRVILMQLP